MKDRVVEFPGRYRDKISGQILELVPEPGEITAVGTPISKATLLTDETASLYGLGADGTPNDAFAHAFPTGQLMAFAGSTNSEILDAAFGKGNEGFIHGIGRQLAMYAWYRGDSKETFPFKSLLRCDTFLDCIQYGIHELWENAAISALIENSPYAKGLMDNVFTPENVRAWKKDYDVLNGIANNATVVNKLRDEYWDIWKENWQTYTARGSVEFTVPNDGRTGIMAEVIGAGGNGGAGGKSTSGGGGAGGGYRLVAMHVEPGQLILGNIVAPGADTTFGDISIATGTGAPGGGEYTDGNVPEQSGKFIRVSGAGKKHNGSGGSAGYGGGNGATNVSGSAGVGSNTLPLTNGTGGTRGTMSDGRYGNNGETAGPGGGGGSGAYGSSSQKGGAGGGGYGGGGGGGGYAQSASYSAGGGGGGSGAIVIYL